MELHDYKLENWLQNSVRTMDGSPDLPRGLFDRLRAAEEVIRTAKANGILPPGPCLLHRSVDGKVQAKTLEQSLAVGRTAGPDVWEFAVPRLSGRHFEVSWDGHESLLKDCGSRNGTWVNGVKVKERLLLEGDIIEAGGLVFVYLASGA